MRASLLIILHCHLLSLVLVSSRADCRTNVNFVDAIQFGDGPLAEPSARFPYIAYSLDAQYAAFFKKTKAEVIADECVGQPFAAQVLGTHGGSRSLTSVSGAGGVPDFRFRSFGSISKKDAEENLPSLGAGGKFRFRDLLSINTTETNLVRIAVTISMDGNISQPMGAIPVAQQRGHTLIRINITDVTFCQGPVSRFVNLSVDSNTTGASDYNQTFTFDACPTALVRIDLMIQLNATAARYSTIGTDVFIGGYAFADYTQCVNGNGVCFEDCEPSELENCSGFSIRARVIDPLTSDSSNGRTRGPSASSVQLISAAGLDYSAPPKTFQPRIHVRNDPTAAVVQWPSTANDWNLSSSPDFAAWTAVTNEPAFDPEQMMFQLPWPATNSHHFFRLENPLAENP